MTAFAPSGRIVRRAGQRRSVVVVLGDDLVWSAADAALARRIGWALGIAHEHVDEMLEVALSRASLSWIAGFEPGERN